MRVRNALGSFVAYVLNNAQRALHDRTLDNIPALERDAITTVLATRYDRSTIAVEWDAECASRDRQTIFNAATYY